MTTIDSTDTIAAVLELTSEGLAITDAAQTVIHANPTFAALSGHALDELIGCDLMQLLAMFNEPPALERLHEVLCAGGCWTAQVLRPQVPHDRLELHVQGVLDAQQVLQQCIARIRFADHATHHAGSAAQIDTLTGLPNRYLLADRFEQALIAGQRAKRSVAVLTIGVDRLARVNDGLGHSVGDLVIQEIARRLSQTVRRSDTVARLESDQFVLLLQVSAQDDTVIVAQKLLSIMKTPLIVNDQELIVTVSVGISIFPTDANDQDDLLKASASAMHHAKLLGGNSYQFFSNSMNLKAKQLIELETELRRALERHEFVVYYQPKVNIESEKIVGAEALVRWNHPQRGVVSPAAFIDVAEESGLIGEIGAWVLNQVCIDNARWLAEGLAVVRISVNVAAPQFRDQGIFDQVTEILATTGLPACYLELEITENMLVTDTEQVIAKLRHLRDLGLHIAIDDFGTGYSSLSYLAKFPITTLKIDRAFIRDLEHQQSTAEITRAIIALSQGLQLNMVAEGAETEQHIDFLRQHGCHTVQGFYYSRPVPSDQFEQLLRDGWIHR